MSLTLLIENFQVLDDGGPVNVQVPESGLQVGRRDGMGWVLPDASRYISGHHFDVSFDGQSWWLKDQSTNGTFLQGHRHRLDGPHRIAQGDRFQVGQYLIVAIFDMPAEGAAMSPGSLPPHRVDRAVDELSQSDPWSLAGFSAAAPIDPLPIDRMARQSDFQDDFIAFPVDAQEAPPSPPPAPPSAQTPTPTPSPPPTDAGPEAAARPVPKVAPLPVPPAAQDGAFLRAFCDGAGLDPVLAAGLDPAMVGQAVGQSLRVISDQVMAALRDRASARHFTRSGERTMRGASDNNPLKFLPDTPQALEALFLRPRAGFLTGADGFDEALGDLRRHQAALFAALQPALIDLLADLDPGRIEAETKAGVTGSRKAKSWESFVQRWDAKTASENGILDEFIRLFAQAYRKADKQ